MPIQGFSTQRLPVSYHLRKGEAKSGNRPGKDLDYFRFDPEGDEDGELTEAFNAIYGDKPKEVTIHFPHAEVDRIWEFWMEEYTAGGLVHRCDGMHIVEYDIYGRIVTTNLECPYAAMALTDPERGCGPVGRITFVDMALSQKVNRVLYGMFSTTSINDIQHLNSIFDFYSTEVLKDRKEGFFGLPFRLFRFQDEISTPGKDRKRVRRSSWLVGLELAPRIVGQALEDGDGKPLSLPESDKVEPEVESGQAGTIPLPSDEQEPEAEHRSSEPVELPASDEQLGKIDQLMVVAEELVAITPTGKARIEAKLEAGMTDLEADEAIEWLSKKIDEKSRKAERRMETEKGTSDLFGDSKSR